MKEPNRIFLEVGPGCTCTMLVKQQQNISKEHVVLSSLRHPEDTRADSAFLLETLGQIEKSKLGAIQCGTAGYPAEAHSSAWLGEIGSDYLRRRADDGPETALEVAPRQRPDRLHRAVGHVVEARSDPRGSRRPTSGGRVPRASARRPASRRLSSVSLDFRDRAEL